MRRRLVLIKHAMPVLDDAVPAREWVLGEEGEEQARHMASELSALAALSPAAVVTSREPKASRTAEIIAAELGLQADVREGLEEIDRPVLPIMTPEEHRVVNRPIFEDRERAGLGNESADAALGRFATAIDELIAGSDVDRDVVVVTHGTVMALFGGEHSPVDPWKLWQRLDCGDVLVFELPGLRLIGASTADEIIAQYEHHAVAFDAHRPKVLFERGWLDRFRELLPDGGSVLDIGCGAGDPMAGYFVERGYRVCGVDSSPSMLELCGQRFPDHEWVLADMRELDLGRAFDGVFAWNSYFHLSREQQRAMFSVFLRHTKPGGALMFTSGAEDGEVIGVLEGDPLYHASLARTEYRELLEAHDFEVVDYVEDDPECGEQTLWLARRVSGT